MRRSDRPASTTNPSDFLASPDPWQQLRQFTRARIALGRAGSSLPTREVLDFGMAHAMARDAVHLPLDVAELQSALASQELTTLQVHSQAPDRATYLLRPDLGRALNEESHKLLQSQSQHHPLDLLLVVADGLSSLAVQRHVASLMAEILMLWPASWTPSPVVIASQARVALGDEIGHLLCARLVAMLIGERPGLSSPDSLGIYLTHDPRPGRHDAERNCISNVRPEGLNYAAAARKLMWLAQEAIKLGLTGVRLKDESDVREIATEAQPRLE